MMSASLHLIDLDQRLPGQREFISCWVRIGTPSFIVDPGPPATAGRLIGALEDLGLERLDYVLLTHIHLDHAGATREILERWPKARVVCHKRGRAHLADPTRLWAGSLAVLKEKAEAYGEPAPVPEAALADYGEVRARGIDVILTPGHAPHHLAFRQGDDLFLGEAAGTFSDLGRGPDNESYYLRPATPPRFMLEVAQDSLDRLLALEPLPRRLLFAHHGAFSGDVRRLLEKARAQLSLWVAVCREIAGADADEAGAEERLHADITAALLDRDPEFAWLADLPEDIQTREQDFTRQTLRGMLGYLQAS